MCKRWNLSPSPADRKIGAGLVNLGNTCFLNTVLQCLMHTLPLANGVLHSDHEVVCRGRGEGDGFCSVCALRQLIRECFFYSRGYCVGPFEFVDNLCNISNHLEPGEQEDAQEFLQSLLNHLHHCWLEPMRKNLQPSLQDESLITKIFGGIMRSQLQCVECGYKSETFEPMLEISLEINEEVNSLADALRSFTAVERMDDASFACEGCKNRVSMDKQLTVEKAPEVLIIHLKRFQYIDNRFLSKINKIIAYPLILDFRPFVNQPAETEVLTYELYAVLVHKGLPYYGHYINYIHSSRRFVWYRMDDSKVTEVDLEAALSQEAYLLFYVKSDPTIQFLNFMELGKKNLGRISKENQREEENPSEASSSSSEASSSSSARQGYSSDEESCSDDALLSSMDRQGQRLCTPSLPHQQNGLINPGASAEITGNLSQCEELVRPNANSFDHCSIDDVPKNEPSDYDNEKQQEAQDQEGRKPSDSEIDQSPKRKIMKQMGPGRRGQRSVRAKRRCNERSLSKTHAMPQRITISEPSSVSSAVRPATKRDNEAQAFVNGSTL